MKNSDCNLSYPNGFHKQSFTEELLKSSGRFNPLISTRKRTGSKIAASNMLAHVRRDGRGHCDVDMRDV